MRAKSIKGKSSEEIKMVLAESMADGFKPTLAIVFLSIRQDRDAISTILDKEGIAIFGVTSCGEFIDGQVEEGAIVMLLMDMKKTDFSILIESYAGREQKDIAKEMGEAALGIFTNPSFLIATSIVIPDGFPDGEATLNGVQSVTGADITIWGGNAGDDRLFDRTHVFTNKQSFGTGIILLVIDADKIMMKGQAAFGWKPSGTERVITNCSNGCIHTIDNQPALDVILKFLGLKLTREEAEKFTPGSVVFCLIRDEGAPVMRSSGYFNWDDRSVFVNGHIKQGTKVRFALPPDFEIVEEVTNDARQIRDEGFPAADALVMFSCIGRFIELGPMISTEIEGVKNTFNAPMAGFFAYGEFGRATKGKNEFHNNTCCWVALKEK